MVPWHGGSRMLQEGGGSGSGAALGMGLDNILPPETAEEYALAGGLLMITLLLVGGLTYALYKLVVLCTTKTPKEADARPGYEKELPRDTLSANLADEEDDSTTSTKLEPDDSSLDAADADTDEMLDNAAAHPDAGASSPICCSST